MNPLSPEPEYSLETPLEETHHSIAQLRVMRSESLAHIAEKLERLLLLDSMSHGLLEEIQELSQRLEPQGWDT